MLIRRRQMVRAYDPRPIPDAVLHAAGPPFVGLAQPVDLVVLAADADRRIFWELAFSVRSPTAGPTSSTRPSWSSPSSNPTRTHAATHYLTKPPPGSPTSTPGRHRTGGSTAAWQSRTSSSPPSASGARRVAVRPVRLRTPDPVGIRRARRASGPPGITVGCPIPRARRSPRVRARPSPRIAAMLLGRRRKRPERGASLVPLSCHFGRLRAVGNGGQRSPTDRS